MNRSVRGIIVGLGACVLAGALWFTGVLDAFEWSTYDGRAGMFASPGPNTEKVITILLDQESLDWAEETMQLPWPWPREVLTYLIDFVARGNPKALAFDVLYTELSDYEYSDDAFAASIGGFGNFVAAVHLEEVAGKAGSETWPAEAPESPDVDGIDTWLATRWGAQAEYPDALFPIGIVAGAAELIGNVSASPDNDAIYRRQPLLGVYEGRVVPALSLAAFIAGADEDVTLSVIKNRLWIGETVVPLDSEGNAIPRFRGPTQTHQAIKAVAILRSQILILEGNKPEIDPAIFENAYVLFGYSAPGLKDLRPSPVDSEYPGVEIHATVLDNILTGDFIQPFSVIASVALLLVLSLAAAITITLAKKVLWQVLMFSTFLILPIALGFFGYAVGLWVPLVLVEAGVLFALIGGTAANYFTEGKQKRFLKAAFQFYLSPEVIEDIIDDPDQLSLGGRRETLTIFFSDLQGFTTITESLQERTPDLINEYLSPMADIIFDENGTIDKYEGDAIIAFWNAPKAYEDHPARGVRTALRCQDELSLLRAPFLEKYGHELHMRIGMNTGKALVGNMGSQTRFDYTMLGDSVNLAARLEGANKLFGTYTMISEYTKEAMGDTFPTRELGRIIVKGKTVPVSVFEPFLPDRYQEKNDVIKVFGEGLSLFYKGEISEARQVFAQIKDEDPAAASYLAVCESDPQVGPDWDGVIELTEK